MKIQVLGSGCPTCKKMHDLVQAAAKDMKLEEKVEYLGGPEGLTKIVELGAMSSPVVTIDGKIVLAGFTPDMEKIKQALTVTDK